MFECVCVCVCVCCQSILSHVSCGSITSIFQNGRLLLKLGLRVDGCYSLCGSLTVSFLIQWVLFIGASIVFMCSRSYLLLLFVHCCFHCWNGCRFFALFLVYLLVLSVCVGCWQCLLLLLALQMLQQVSKWFFTCMSSSGYLSRYIVAAILFLGSRLVLFKCSLIILLQHWNVLSACVLSCCKGSALQVHLLIYLSNNYALKLIPLFSLLYFLMLTCFNFTYFS